jgi:Bacterial Ig-like domain (group 3)
MKRMGEITVSTFRGFMFRRIGVITIAITAIFVLCTGLPGFAQSTMTVRRDVHRDISPPLREMIRNAPPPSLKKREVEPMRTLPLPPGLSQLEEDPVLQRTVSLATPTTGLSFEGLGNGQYGFSVTGTPPDTEGTVGATQYVQWVNTSFAIFNKTTGALVAGPTAGNTLWSGFGGGCQSNNDGDPIVLYDKAAQRWVFSQFSVSTTPYLQCVAVSTTSDATGTYNRYSFQYTNFDDYPKMGVWSDAYYETFNMFSNGGNTFAGADACAFNRTAMLAGTAATQVCFQQGSSVGGLLPSDIDGTTAPPAGSPNYMIYYGTNSLNLYKFHVDFTTPSNSTFTGPTVISVASFSPLCSGGTCVPQPGTRTLDSLADRLMYRLSYRNFGTYESLLVNHSVVAGSSGGVRWYEIQNPGGTPIVAQQSTFAPDSNYRWMGSIAQDQSGNMALGYSVSSKTVYPSISYTGRLATDPASTMESEVSVVTGAGSESTYSRWGDYSAMQVDPVDDCTFWYTQMYQKANGSFNWNTRIMNFKFPTCGSSLATTTTAVTSSLNPSTYGQSVSFTANVTSGSGTPTGTVQFTVDGSNFGSAVTLVSGSATSGSTSTLTGGTHTVTAVYSGDTGFQASTGTLSGGQVVNKASQSITFTTNAPASAAYGSNFTVAATASSGLAVTFTSAGGCSNSGATYTMTSGTTACSVIANQAGNSNYSAATQVTQSANATLASQSITFTTNAPASAAYNSQFTVAATASSGLAVAYTSSGSCSNSGATYTMTSGTGTCSVIANQAGNSNYSAATQVTESVGATPASQTITFTTNPPASAAYNSQFTVAATASSGLAVAYTSSGSCSNSGATYTMTSGTGTCSVIANQAGNANYAAATPVTKSVTATPASASVSVGSTLDPSAYGQAVSFTASVTGAGPTGTVQFNIDGGAFGSPVTLVSGLAASGSIATLTSGTHTVTATYSGDTNNGGSTGTLAGGQVVGAANASVSVASSLNPSTYGQSVTFTATINGANGMIKGRNGVSGVKPQSVTGTVTWSSNTGCGTTTVSAGNPGTATCTTSGLGVGTDAITATYSGDSNHNGGTGTLSGGQVVNQAGVNVSVGSTLDPSTYGQAVSFTASVTGSSPTGTVQFNIDGGAFGSPVTLVSGSATSGSITTLSNGTHTVTAVYSGDTNNNSSTGTLNGGQVVNSAGAGVSVASSLNPSSYSQSVTFTATISGANGLVKGNGRKPLDISGTVTWSANTGCDPTAVTSGNPGTATCTTSSLPVGTDTITATYSGDSNHNGSTGTLSGGQVVNQASTATSVASSLNPASYGQAVNFTANVTSGLGTPGGTVQFKIDGSAFGSPVTLVSGSATSGSISTLTVGTHTATAVYSAAAGYAGSTGTLSGGQVVSSASAGTVVTSSLNPSVSGQAVTFTATISGANGLVKGNGRKPQDVTGTVTWSANTGCGTTAVTSGNPGTATCTTSNLPVGTDTITATYSGDSNHSGSTGTLSGGQVVNPAASQTITFNPNPPSSAAYNTSFTVAATASSGLPVTFTSTGSCTNVGATYSVNSGTGTCWVIANQAGNAQYSPAPQVTVPVSAVPAAQTITVSVTAPPTATNKSSFTVVASASSGLPIAFSSSGACINSGATYTINKTSGTCTVTMTQAGNGNYAAATPVVETTTVAAPTAPVVSLLGAPPTAVYGSAFTVTASSNETGPEASIPVITTTAPTICSVSGSTTSGTSVSATVTMLKGAGSCALKATWAANYVYSAATATAHSTATKITPTVSFTGAPTSASNGSNFTVTATSNESGTYAVAPTITTTTGTVCSVGALTSNGPGSYQATVTMVKASGTCTTKAAWATSSGYAAASVLQHTTAKP